LAGATGAVETGGSAATAHAKRRKTNPAAISIKRFIFLPPSVGLHPCIKDGTNSSSNLCTTRVEIRPGMNNYPVFCKNIGCRIGRTEE